jgi:hypothetical protein
MLIKSWVTGETLRRVPADSLEGADLSGLDLRFAYFSEMSLRGANLRGSDLRCAYFNSVDLKSASVCGADLRIPQEFLQELWDKHGSAVYNALVQVKEELLRKGSPDAGRLWTTFTGLLLLAGVSGSIKGVVYDDLTRWPDAGGAPYNPKKNGARHVDHRWWKPWA